MSEKLKPIYRKLEEKFGDQVTREFKNPEDMALFLFSISSDLMLALGREKMLFMNCMTQLYRVSP